eukprot:CAMPEP_0167754810 /NCGR_PEP_ID=MMETSP0110_2-20121227/8478_1 /TAXON_ID=629695 /ORGANISM="Gymnochlora sp., Strain CCMP2014" /LENGTH=592 /DNA_ID=CAMNT_0007640733 /DNA_START=102 /DNA_END=1880 /DNA_ORIENTATION=-
MMTLLMLTLLGSVVIWYGLYNNGPTMGSDAALDDIPVPGVFMDTQAERSVDSPPKMMILVPMEKWPLRSSREKQIVGEILRIFQPRATLKFVVCLRAFEKFPKSSIEGLSEAVITVNCRLESSFLWELTWRGLKKVAQHSVIAADWFAVMPVHSFVVTTNLAAYASYLDPTEPYYLGHVKGLDTWTKEGILYNDKSAYVLSRGALRKLYLRLQDPEFDNPKRGSSLFQCRDSGGTKVGIKIGTCLREIGIEPLETRDSTGKQRFLESPPKKRAEFKKSSAYPISFGMLGDVQAYQSMEYFTIRQPYIDAFHGVEPPSGRPFRIIGSESLSMDGDGNNPTVVEADSSRAVGGWLQTSQAHRCLSDVSHACTCDVNFSRLPKGLKGQSISSTSACTGGSTVSHGKSCGVACSRNGNVRGIAKCFDGILVLPEITCDSEAADPCQIPLAPANTVYEPSSGSIASGKEITATCSPGYSLSGGKKSRKFQCYRGEIAFGPGCQRCGEWNIMTKGSKYQLKTFKDIKFTGVASDEFEVTAVATGSSQDPLKNCGQYAIAEQLILQEKSTSVLVSGLSCNNQEIHVVKTTFKETGKCSY